MTQFQAIGIWGISQAMTGPELLDWARFHNMRFTESPCMFVDFRVERVDLEPLSQSQREAFASCVWRQSHKDDASPEQAAEAGNAAIVRRMLLNE